MDYVWPAGVSVGTPDCNPHPIHEYGTDEDGRRQKFGFGVGWRLRYPEEVSMDIVESPRPLYPPYNYS